QFLEGSDAVRKHDLAAWELVNQGRFEEALAEAQKTRELHPRYYLSLVVGAHARRRLKDIEGCERDVARAVAISRDRPEAYLERGWLRIEQGRDAEAAADAETVRARLSLRSDMEGALCDLEGFVYTRLGRLDDARRAFDRFVAL